MRKVLPFILFLFFCNFVLAFNWKNEYLAEGKTIFNAEFYSENTGSWVNYTNEIKISVTKNYFAPNISIYRTGGPSTDFFRQGVFTDFYEGGQALNVKLFSSSTVDGSTKIRIYNLDNYTTLNLRIFVFTKPPTSELKFTCGTREVSYPLTTSSPRFLYDYGPHLIYLNTTNCSKTKTPNYLDIDFIFYGGSGDASFGIDNVRTFNLATATSTNFMYSYTPYYYNFTTKKLFSNNLITVYNYSTNLTNYNYNQDIISIMLNPNEEIFKTSGPFYISNSGVSDGAVLLTIPYGSLTNYQICPTGYSVSYTFENLTGNLTITNGPFLFVLDNMTTPQRLESGGIVNASNQNLTILLLTDMYNFTNRIYNGGFVNITNYSLSNYRKCFYLTLNGIYNNSKAIHPYLTTYLLKSSLPYLLKEPPYNRNNVQTDFGNLNFVISNSSLKIGSMSGGTSEESYTVFNQPNYTYRNYYYNSITPFKAVIYTPTGYTIQPTATFFDGQALSFINYYNISYDFSYIQPDYKTKVFDNYGNCYEVSGIPSGYNTSLIYYITATYCSGVYSSSQISLPVLPVFQKCYYNSTDSRYYINIKYLTEKPFFIYYLNASNDTNSLLSTTRSEINVAFPVNFSVSKLIASVNGTTVCYYSNSSIFNIPEFVFGSYKSLISYPLFLGVYVLSIPFPYASILILVINDAFKLFSESMIFVMVIMAGIVGSVLNTETKQSLRAMITYTMVVLGYILLMIINFPQIEAIDTGFSAHYAYISNYVNQFYDSIEGITNLALTPDNASNWIRSATTLGSLLIQLPNFITTLIGAVLIQIHPSLASVWFFLSKFFLIIVFTTIALKIFTIVMNQFDKEAV